MRYLITMNHEGPIDEGAVPEAMYADMGAFVEKLAADGILVDGAGLERLDKATRVTHSDGEVKVVDGPFSEAKEWLGGYFILQVRSHAEAVEYAKHSIDLHRKHVPHMSVMSEVRRIEDV